MRRHGSAPAVVLAGILLAACGDAPVPGDPTAHEASACVSDFDPAADYYSEKAEIRHAENFSISYHGHYKVLRARLEATNWGPEVSDVLVLNKCGTPVPPLEGDLAGAPVIETPVTRFATNSLASALRLRVLGLDDRIVAMPANPFDPALAELIESGRIVPAGVHGEPHLEGMLVLGVEALVVFTSSLEHAAGLERARELGVPTLPLLSWAEPTYLGQAEWIKHHAALFDAEAEAEAFFADVEARYRELARTVAGREPVPTLWATPMERGRWWVEAGNWQDEVLTAAGGRNVFTARPDESSIVLGTERIVDGAGEARVWITNDPDPRALDAAAPLAEIPAWTAGRTWHVHGRSDPTRDAFDWNEQFDLALDPERAKSFHDQTLPGDNYREARFCSMCGVDFCSMRIDQDARDVEDGEMDAIDDETDLAGSPAAEVNLPPVGTHDTSDVPEQIEIDGVTFTPEGHAGD